MKMKENNAKINLKLMQYKALNNSMDSQEDINAVSMVERLFIVTTDAQEIWDAFQSLQPSFFEKILIQKYEIGADFSSKIMKKFT